MSENIFGEEINEQNSPDKQKLKNSGKNSSQNLSFEELLGRLEKITEQINSQDVSLEESLKLFKEGSQLAKKAHEILENAKLSISEFEGEQNER